MSENQQPNEVINEEQEELILTLDQLAEMGLLNVDKEPTFRHTQIFDTDISAETVQGLINELNNYKEIDLFFSTPGGAMVAMEALIHYLNGRKDDIKIFLTDEICSAGTFLLTDFEGCIVISKGLDLILFHVGDRLTYVNRKDEINRKELNNQLKILNAEWAAKFQKLGLTEKEIKRFKYGKDVILYRKDFHRLSIPCQTKEVGSDE